MREHGCEFASAFRDQCGLVELASLRHGEADAERGRLATRKRLEIGNAIAREQRVGVRVDEPGHDDATARIVGRETASFARGDTRASLGSYEFDHTVAHDDRRVAHDAKVIVADARVAVYARGQRGHRDGDCVDQSVRRRAWACYHVTARGSSASR